MQTKLRLIRGGDEGSAVLARRIYCDTVRTEKIRWQLAELIRRIDHDDWIPSAIVWADREGIEYEGSPSAIRRIRGRGRK